MRAGYTASLPMTSVAITGRSREGSYRVSKRASYVSTSEMTHLIVTKSLERRVNDLMFQQLDNQDQFIHSQL